MPESQSFLPTANTCVGNLQLPRPTHETPLPAEEQLFKKFDMAFSIPILDIDNVYGIPLRQECEKGKFNQI